RSRILKLWTPECRSRIAMPSPEKPLPMISTSRVSAPPCRVSSKAIHALLINDNVCCHFKFDNNSCQHCTMTDRNAAEIVTGRRFRGVAADERRRQRRQQLLDAGLKCFGTVGFRAAGVRDICAEAQLTERYFYESFKNREALFLAVYEMGVN